MALITADEMAMAGGVVSVQNSNYYLYNGQYQWSISPGFLDKHASRAHVWLIMSSGDLYPWRFLTDSFGVRPVINLKSDTLITKGDGTSLNPFTVS